MRLIDADAIDEEQRQVHGFFYDFDLQELLDEQPTVMQWVPVTEKLPKEEGYFFVTDEAAGMAETQIDKYIRCDDGEWVWLYSQHVVAWMPLPEPYRGGEP